ncbi:MAG: HypC/HybG/HupF family hydrogenase formation chaperone [Clostridium sp.]
MCVAVPGKIINVFEMESLVDFEGYIKRVNTALIEEPKIGDYVLVHVGCAIEKVTKDEATKSLDILKKLSGENYNEY